MIRSADTPGRRLPRSGPILAFLILILILASVVGCGDDDQTPSGPGIGLRQLTVVISLVRGIDILEGEGVVAGYGGSHRFPWARHTSSASTRVSVVADRFSTWQFDVEGRLYLDPDTTGYGLLYTQARDIDMLSIGDTLGVTLEFIVPRISMTPNPAGFRLTWQPVSRALAYELRQTRAGHPDSVFTIADTDTTILRAFVPDRKRYQVRAVLRDDRVTAYSIPIVVAP